MQIKGVVKVNSPAEMGQLVSSIYDAAVDSALWPAFMERLAASLKASLGMFWMHDFRKGTARFENDGGNLSAVKGLDASALARYANYHIGLNVWLPHTSQLAEGSIAISSALYPDSLLKRTAFYSEFLRVNDLFYAVGCSIVKQDGRDVKMCFFRSEGAGGYGAAELHLFRQLMPHLRNAVLLHRELHRLKVLSASAMAALEMLPLGVILLTGSGMLLHANRRAHELVALTSALRFGAGGSLQAASASATLSLQRLIQNAVSAGAGKTLAQGGTLRLGSSSGRALQVLVTPLPAGTSPFGRDAAAAIFCSDPDSVVNVLPGTLEILFRMTPAEAHLTESLVNGRSLKRYAEVRGVSMNTVRTQLKAVAAKTGATSQADLVRIVLTGPASLHRSGDLGQQQQMALPG